MSDNQQLLKGLRDFLQRRRLAGDNSITAVDLDDEDLVFTYEGGKGVGPVQVRVSGMRAVLDVLDQVTKSQARAAS